MADAHPGSGRALITDEGGQRIAGVLASARLDGRYDVSLALVAYPVPLHELADRIRTEIARASTVANLEGSLGDVAVAFEDVRPRGAS